MGLFDFISKSKPVVVPEPDKSAVDSFFTEEAALEYKRSLRLYDEMVEKWDEDCTDFVFFTHAKGSPHRVEYPCTIFADYLRALKCMDIYRLAVFAAVAAYEGEERISYPDCLKSECNPFINFAIKIKPIIYSKNGEDLQFSGAMDILLIYLSRAFSNGSDESNEEWMYDNSLWFNDRGKPREHYELIQIIKRKVKTFDYIADLV